MANLLELGTSILSSNHLNEELNKSNKNTLNIIYFYTKWSQECEALESTIKHMATTPIEKSINKLFLIECNASNNELINFYNVKLVPSTIFIKDGKMVANIQGFNPKDILKTFEHYSNVLTEQLISQSTQNNLTLDEKIHQLINCDNIMLFMKGSKEEPFCKFSKRMIALLNQYTTNYSTFNVFADMDIRERIKTISNWPSFPQLYVKGELIGGCDIAAEMDAQGELKSILLEAIGSNDANESKKLEELINQAHIMLFMKGTPDQPFCGFSKSVISILRSYTMDFGYFDILTDEKVRADLKVYSDWPTYPQLYVKGELLGGYDIVKELHESGDLKNYLQL